MSKTTDATKINESCNLGLTAEHESIAKRYALFVCSNAAVSVSAAVCMSSRVT